MNATEFIKQWEKCKLAPYLPTPQDRPTIGWGNTFYEDGRPVTMADPAITQAAADALLAFWVSATEDRVNGLAKVELTPNQLAALTSFEYNTGHLSGSTLLKKLNAGDPVGAADELQKWIHQGAVVLRGLQRRRAAERALFLTGQQ